MPSLIRIHSGTALCVLILGTTTMLWSQNAHQQETNGGDTVAPVQHAAASPRSDADPAQQSRSKTGAHPDNSAISPAGGKLLFHNLQLSRQPLLDGRSYQRQAMVRRRGSFSLRWERPWLPQSQCPGGCRRCAQYGADPDRNHREQTLGGALTTK